MKGGTFLALIGAVAVLSTAAAQSDCDIVCTRNLRPVCGSDGKSYANECVLRAEACKANMLVVVASESACPGDTQFASVLDNPTIVVPPLTTPPPAVRPINPNRPAFVFSPNLPESQQGQMVGGPIQTSANGNAELRGPVQPVMIPTTPQYQLLRHYGHLQYHIEYHRFLSNHVAHGIVALNRLGADSATMDTWAMAYGRKLEPPVQDDTHITPDTFPAFIGANRSYLPLVRFLESELANQKAAGGDWRSLLRNYVPRLADGVSGAAFHGLLHLGYGVAVAEEDDGSIDLVIEGLAYAAFSHHPLGPLTSPIGQPANQNKRSLLEVLEAVRHDVRFSSALAHTNDSSNRSLHYFSSNGFQVKMHILGQYAFDALQEHIEALRIYHTPTPTGSDARDWLNSQGRDLLLGLLHVFIHCTIPNDFFILHTITACWALRKILPYLAEDDQHEALIHFTKSALAGYIARSAPEIHEKIPPNKNSDAKPWTELRDACFADPEKDEHTIKLVMVCFELAQELRLEGEYIGNLNAVKDVGLADAGSGVRGGWSGREVERELRIAGTQSLGGFLL